MNFYTKRFFFSSLLFIAFLGNIDKDKPVVFFFLFFFVCLFFIYLFIFGKNYNIVI